MVHTQEAVVVQHRHSDDRNQKPAANIKYKSTELIDDTEAGIEHSIAQARLAATQAIRLKATSSAPVQSVSSEKAPQKVENPLKYKNLNMLRGRAARQRQLHKQHRRIHDMTAGAAGSATSRHTHAINPVAPVTENRPQAIPAPRAQSWRNQ